MALGNYNNSNKAEYKDPTVYSNYTFSNPESKVDATKLSFKYWKNSLAISISPRKNTNDSTISYDYQNQITIYLSHTKARILAEQIKALLSDEKLDSVGVNSGSSIITINRGTKYGTSNFVMEIVGLGEDGSATGSIKLKYYDIDNGSLNENVTTTGNIPLNSNPLIILTSDAEAVLPNSFCIS